MFQTVGHEGISLYAEAMQLPLFQQTTQCKTTSHNSLSYQPTDDKDEVEDLYHLLKRVKVNVTVNFIRSCDQLRTRKSVMYKVSQLEPFCRIINESE